MIGATSVVCTQLPLTRFIGSLPVQTHFENVISGIVIKLLLFKISLYVFFGS